MKLTARLMVLVMAMTTILAVLPGTGGAAVSEEEKIKFQKNMLLPSPAEVFLAIDRLGAVDWSDAASYDSRYDYKNNYLRALNLGVRAADGFLAIQSKDKKKLGEMIVVIMTLAEELLVSETILANGQKFEDLAKRDKWVELRKELDKLRDDIMVEMQRMGDKDVSLLVSAGGWLEGLRATSRVLALRYSEGASSILYQPRLVDYFSQQMANMSPAAKKDPLVKALSEQLPEIRKLVDVGYMKPVPKENVIKLYEISGKLVSAIEKG